MTSENAFPDRTQRPSEPASIKLKDRKCARADVTPSLAKLRLFIFLPLCLSLSACAVRQLQTDNDNLRTALMQNVDDQIMDNLIRGYRKLPIVQFDYGTISADVTTTLGATGNDGRTVVDTETTGVGGVLASAVSAVTKPETYSLSPSQAKKISVVMTPVNKNNEVYEAYEAFLANDGIETSPNKPPASDVHMIRRVEGQYYWVPKTKANDFFNLALVTTVKRGGSSTTDSANGGEKKVGIKPISKSTTDIPALQSKALSPPASSGDADLEDIRNELRQLRIDQ